MEKSSSPGSTSRYSLRNSDNEARGPEVVAALRDAFLAGRLGDVCDRILDDPDRWHTPTELRQMMAAVEITDLTDCDSATDFVTTVYKKVLNREPDRDGFTYWTLILTLGVETPAKVLADIYSARATYDAIGQGSSTLLSGQSISALLTAHPPAPAN